MDMRRPSCHKGEFAYAHMGDAGPPMITSQGDAGPPVGTLQGDAGPPVPTLQGDAGCQLLISRNSERDKKQ